MSKNAVMPSKRPKLVVYLTPDVIDDFRRLAEIKNRSASNLAETVILEAIWKAKQSGELPEEPTNTDNQTDKT